MNQNLGFWRGRSVMGWHVRVLIVWLSLGVSAGSLAAGDPSTEPLAVFAPAAAGKAPTTDIALLGRQEAITVQLEPLRSTATRYARLRMDFLGQTVVVQRKQLQRGTGTGTVWYGRPVDQDGTVVLSVTGKVVFGRIELGQKVYKIEPTAESGVHKIYELDPSKERPLENDFLVPSIQPQSAPDNVASDARATKGADDGTVLDMLIVYTNGFAAAYPGDALDAQINFLVGVANAAYSNSLISLRARVVGKQQVTYADGGTLPLSDLTNGVGAFSSVPTWRNTVGADVVSLLRVFKVDNNACGVAWVMPTLSPAFESNAYSVVQVGSDGGYYCTDQTFVHEVGHNMGSNHNLETATGGTARVYTYSLGMEFPRAPATPLYHTVMSYNLTGTSRVTYFTNPNVQYSGYTTGLTDQADNARSHNNVKLTATQWRAAVPLFADVPTSHFAWEWVEGLYRSGITGGCNTGPLRYCPNDSVTRAQMAVFLERGINGATYSPPAATGTLFNDVGSGDFAAAWIEQLASDGITGGCGGGNYCPNAAVTRAQMAIFLLRAEHGAVYAPPAATGTMFTDVAVGTFGAAWIEQLATEGITSGCGGGNYCPNDSVTRAQMAVFLIKTFGLPY